MILLLIIEIILDIIYFISASLAVSTDINLAIIYIIYDLDYTLLLSFCTYRDKFI